MELRMTKQDTDRAHRGSYVKLDRQVAPDQPSRKSPPHPSRSRYDWLHLDKRGRDTESTERTRKSSRLQEKRQNIPAPTSGAPVNRKPVSARKRRRGQDGIVETQAKRQKSRNQARPSRAVDTDAPTLTSNNLKYLDRQAHSQHLSSTKTTLKEWEFVNMLTSQKTKTQSQRTKDTSSSTKTVSTSDPRFQKIAAKKGILVPMESTEPNNFDEIWNRLNRPRQSASPDAAAFREYLFDAATAGNEDTVKQAVVGRLKKYNDGSYRSAHNQQFTEYPDNVGFNDGLSAPKPDLVQDINLQAFDSYPVVEQLGGSAVPIPDPYAITLAHMTGEFMRPGGDLIQARGQAAYAGASLVYGRNAARESIGRTDPPNTAHIGSFISDGTHITTFAHYATKDASGKTVYHQWPVTDTNIQLSHQNFKIGRRQVRNLQDWTRENSYLLKEELSQAQSTEQRIPEGKEDLEHGNGDGGDGSAGSSGGGSEPCVLVESLPVLETEASYVTPQSSDSARSRRHAPNAHLAKTTSNQRHTRSSARLSRRCRLNDRG